MPVKPLSFAWCLLRGLLRPAVELARLADLAHLGEISIEELTSASVARGRWKPLVQVIARILLDLKQQRAELAGLEQEMRDRIANRTDALERKIGSLQLQATRDVLSGLGNRRGLEAALPRLIEQYNSSGTNCALLMIDVDHFKPLNDTLGHAAGDQLLRELGQLIRSTLRGNDQAFRCGGDEFVVLLHACDFNAGMLIARRLEQLVKGLTNSLRVVSPPQLSIGVCALSELNPPTADSFLQTADARLYAVKSQRPQTRRSA
jgi:diguanylate cyclase (GGDEF)-like protein